LFRSRRRRERGNRGPKRGRGRNERAEEPPSFEEIKSNMERMGREGGIVEWRNYADLSRQLFSKGAVSYDYLVRWQMTRLREEGAFEYDPLDRGPMEPARRERKLREKAQNVLREWRIIEPLQ